jgi:hypothetical protein
MFKELLIGLARELSSREIPYMIIGGQAVILYGEPRLTRDVDITLGVGKEQLETLLNICTSLQLAPIPENVRAFVEETMVLPALEQATGIRVDFIFSYTPYERQAIARAGRILLDNVPVCFALPEDVIIHKVFAHRPRDLEDARSIMLKSRNLDVGYIRNWLAEFSSAEQDMNLLELFDGLVKETE